MIGTHLLTMLQNKVVPVSRQSIGARLLIFFGESHSAKDPMIHCRSSNPEDPKGVEGRDDFFPGLTDLGIYAVNERIYASGIFIGLTYL